MNVEALIPEQARQGSRPVVTNDGCMISHDNGPSTSCANNKHILSLDVLVPFEHHFGMKIGERIKSYRQSRGMSQADLAKAINAGQTAVSSWERGRTIPSRDAVVRIADALRIPPSDIERFTEESTMQMRFKEIPVISWVSAGRLSDPGELYNISGERLLAADLPSGDYFATDVRGDSMDRLSPEGSRLLVNAGDRTPIPGRFYIFSLRGETTFKRFENDPIVRLEPFSTNPANKPIYPKSERDWMVMGRVIRSTIDLV